MKNDSFRRFLAGVDGTGHSDDAVHAAKKLARRIHAEVRLVHAVPVPPAMYIGIDRETLAEMHRAALKRAETDVRARLAARETEYGLESGELSEKLEVLPGDAAKVLVDCARESNPDVLFLGRHRQRELFQFGRTARALLPHSPCAMWLQPVAFEGVERILAPTDLSPASRAALPIARDLAAALDVPVTILHCFAPPNLAYAGQGIADMDWGAIDLEALRERTRGELDRTVDDVDWGNVKFEKTFTTASPDDEILRRQDPRQVTVMGTHGHTGLSGWLFGHVTWTVMRKAEAPVLAVRSSGSSWLI